STFQHLHVRAGQENFRLVINVGTRTGDNVLFFAKDNFDHPILGELSKLSSGFTSLSRNPSSLAIDYLRSAGLVDVRLLKPTPSNEVIKKLEEYLGPAIDDPGILIYAYGNAWGPEEGPDKIFGFVPGRGIHNIHYNQGNVGRFMRDNGPWQDGAI